MAGPERGAGEGRSAIRRGRARRSRFRAPAPASARRLAAAGSRPASRRRSSSGGSFPGSQSPSGSASCSISRPRDGRRCGRRSPGGDRRRRSRSSRAAADRLRGRARLRGRCSAASPPASVRERRVEAPVLGRVDRRAAERLRRERRGARQGRAHRHPAERARRARGRAPAARVRVDLARPAGRRARRLHRRPRRACCRRRRRRGRAATISPATPISAASAPSARSPARSRCAPPAGPPPFDLPVDRDDRRGPQHADPPHRRCDRRPGRRGRGGARHRQARPHHGGHQRGPARRRHLPHRLDLRPAHGACRRHLLLARARAARAIADRSRCAGRCKKIAAVVAMIGATAYCVFSGSEVATERSLIMILVMLGAILVDRPALIDAQPRAVGADRARARARERCSARASRCRMRRVAALIAAAEWAARPRPRRRAGRRRSAAPALAGSVARRSASSSTTLVATLATAPFGSLSFPDPAILRAHRQRARRCRSSRWSSCPARVFGVLAYPFGLDRADLAADGDRRRDGARGLGTG